MHANIESVAQIPEDLRCLAPEDIRALARFKELAEQVLPAMAREGRWPIRFDHCFKRICLDWAFGDVWYKYLARPAERHIEGDALRRAVSCAAEIASGGLPILRDRNAASLRWRGKIDEGRTAALTTKPSRKKGLVEMQAGRSSSSPSVAECTDSMGLANHFGYGTSVFTGSLTKVAKSTGDVG